MGTGATKPVSGMGSLDKHLRDPEYANWVKTGLALKIANNAIKPYVISESENFKTSIESNCLSGPTRRTFETEIKNSHRFTNPSYNNCNRYAWTTDSWEVAKCFMPSLKRYELCTPAEADFSAIVNVIINNRHFEPLVKSDLSTNGNIFCQARNMRNNVMHSNDQKVTESDFQNNADLLIQIIGSFKSVLPHYAEAVDKINRLKTGHLIIKIDDVSDARREGLVAMTLEVEKLVMKVRQEAEVGQVILKEMVEISKEDVKGQIDVEIGRLRQVILSNTSISKEHRIRANFKDGCHHSLLALFPNHIQRHRPENKRHDEWTLLDFLRKIEYAPEMGIFSERHRDMLYPSDGEPVTPYKWDLFLLCQFLLVETKIELPNGIALYLKGLKTIRNKLLENPESVDFDDLVSLSDFLDEPVRESTKQIFCRDKVDVDIVLVDSVLNSWRANENNFSQSKVYERHLNGNMELLRIIDELKKQIEENKKDGEGRYNEIMDIIKRDKSSEADHLGTRPNIKSCIKLNPINCEKTDALRVERNITSKEGNLAKENGSINTFTKMMNLEGTEPKDGSIILEITVSSIKDLIDFWDKCMDGRAVEALRDVRNTYRKFVGCQDLEFEIILTKQEVDRCLNQIGINLKMGAGATKPVTEPVEFDSKNIIAQNQENTRVTLKQHTNDVTAISCFSSSKLSMRNDSEKIKISVRGAGVLRIGVTEKDPKLQLNFAEDPLFEQEDGFEPGSAERVLYYHENLEMFCFGPADKFMEFSPNRTKSSSEVFLYVMFLYGKPTVSVTYTDVVVKMATFETSNIRTLEDSSMTVATLKNVSIMKLKKKIEHGNVYHIQWNMELSKEKFAKKTPKFGYLRIGLMNGGSDDINAFSINAEEEESEQSKNSIASTLNNNGGQENLDENTIWARESAVIQYPYSGTIALAVNRNNVNHNLLLSSVEKNIQERLPEQIADKPCYLFVEAASGEFTIQRSPQFSVKQGLGTTYYVKSHKVLSGNSKYEIERDVGHEPYHIQYGLDPQSFVIMFNKYFTNADEIKFKKVFGDSEKIGKFDTIQVLYEKGELSKYKIEEAFSRWQQTGGGKILRDGTRKSENVSRCWIIRYKHVEDARRVWLRRELDIEGIKVFVLPWYKELGEAVNYGKKPILDETDLIVSDIDQDKLRFVVENERERTKLGRKINIQVPTSLVLQEVDEFEPESNDNLVLTIRCDLAKCRDHKTRATWKEIVEKEVQSYFEESIVSEEFKFEDRKSYERAVKMLEEMEENKNQDGCCFVFRRNRQDRKLTVITSSKDLVDTISAEIANKKQLPNKKSLVIPKDEIDKYRYHALDDEGLLKVVRNECSNTRFKVTDKGEIELQGPEAEVQNAKDKICNLAIHMSLIHEPLSEGKMKVLQHERCSESLQKALKDEKLSYHFKIEDMLCKLWICTSMENDIENKSKLFKKCINNVVHEITINIPNKSKQVQLNESIETMLKDTLQIHFDEKGENLFISGTKQEVNKAEKYLYSILAETPKMTIRFVFSLDILEYIETWCEQFKTEPYNLRYDDRDSNYIVPVEIGFKSTETTKQKLENELLLEVRNIKSHWFHLTKPWLAVHREQINDIVKSFMRKHPATIDIETAPSLIHKNISGVALQTNIGATSLPICCDITQCRVDVIVVPIDADNYKQAKSSMTNKVINLAGKVLEDECKSNGQLVPEKPLILPSGKLPCQRVILVYLPRRKDVSCVEAFKACLKSVQDASFSSVMIPIKPFCNESKLDQSIDELVKAVDTVITKNQSWSIKEIGLCDTKLDMVERIEKSMKTNLKKPWFTFWHGKKLQSLKEDQDARVIRPLSSKGQRTKDSILWGATLYGLKKATEDERESDDEDIQRTVTADFENGLPYKLELTDTVQLQIIRGSIETMDTDVVVNPSPLFPEQSGAIFNALVKKGGKSIVDECKKQSKIQPGEVKETNAGKLKCKKLYHTLQPTDWKQDTGFGSVYEIVRQSLETAHRNQVTSIAFPAIGTGASRFPADKVAEAMVKAVFEFIDKFDPSTVQTIFIVIYYADNATSQVFQDIVPNLISRPRKPQKQNKDRTGTGKEDKRVEIAKKQMKKLMFLPSKKPDVHTESDDLMFMKLTMKGDIKAAIKDFEELVCKTFVRKDVIYGELEIGGAELSSNEVKQIQNIEMIYNVRVTLNTSKHIVTIEGLRQHVNNAESALTELLRLTIPTERKATRMKEEVMKHVQWLYEDNGQFKPYDEASNFDIQFGYLDQRDFEYTNSKENKRYKVVIQTLEEHPVTDSTKKRRMIQRQKVQKEIHIPETWTIQGTEKDQELVTLDPSSGEFDEVKTKFVRDGCLVNNILNIIRIEDRYKYLQYMSKKIQIDKQNRKGMNNERKLWHGTDGDTYTKIIKNGFDRSFAGKNATVHGKGVYFATTSHYSHGYAVPDASGTCRMFLNKVLVGEYCTSNRDMIVLPEKRTINNVKVLYDSAANDPKHPSIFIIFHDTQAYPEYLIEYV